MRDMIGRLLTPGNICLMVGLGFAGRAVYIALTGEVEFGDTEVFFSSMLMFTYFFLAGMILRKQR